MPPIWRAAWVSTAKQLRAILTFLVDLPLVRRLPAWHRNAGKRLVKSPKVYVRDSGIAHALLGIRDKEALPGHPVVGQTWESFVIETLIATAPDGTEAQCADLRPQKRFVVYPGPERFPLDDVTDAIDLVGLAKALQSAR